MSVGFKATQRLGKELAKLIADPPDGCSAGPKTESNMKEWTATIIGPSNSPYENGVFELDITFPDNYPIKPPKVHFVTPVYHCNVNPQGHICLDILQSKWSPVISISLLLLSIRSLFTDPNPDSPLRGDVATLYKTHRSEHDAKARAFTIEHAMN